MNIRIIFLLTIVCSTAHADLAKTIVTQLSPKRGHVSKGLTPTELLLKGIVSSSPADVEKALKQGAQLRARVDQFGDTPLMLSVRVLGHIMKSHLEARTNKGTRLSMLVGTLVIAQLLLRQVATLVPARWENPYNIFNFAALALPIGLWCKNAMTPSIVTKRAARVIIMLLQHDPQIDLRNYESLTAHEILQAYYPVARDLQNQEWFVLRKIFSKIQASISNQG